jgi:hypothetical protein
VRLRTVWRCVRCGWHVRQKATSVRQNAQDSVVADLEDETETRSADAECPLQCDVLGLNEEKRVCQKMGTLQGAMHTSRMLLFVFSKRPATGSL